MSSYVSLECYLLKEDLFKNYLKFIKIYVLYIQYELYIIGSTSIEHWYGNEFKQLTLIINHVTNIGKGSFF